MKQQDSKMHTAEEIERKFIIRIPDRQAIAKMPEYTESEITQTYLSSPAGITHRVRKRVYTDRTVYTETIKNRIDRISAMESEREIDEDCYLDLLKNIKPGTHPVHKTRYTFRLGGQVYEIDVYPKWKRTCILETELHSRGEHPPIPPMIRVIREVTGTKGYSNAGMSKKFPKEDIIDEN